MMQHVLEGVSHFCRGRHYPFWLRSRDLGGKSKNEKWERAQDCFPFHLLISHPHSDIFFWVKEFLSRHPLQGESRACVKSLQSLCELALSASLIGSSGSLLMWSSISHMTDVRVEELCLWTFWRSWIHFNTVILACPLTLRWSLRHFRGSGCFERPGHLLPGEGRPKGRVRRPFRPQCCTDGEREGVGDAVPG